MVLTAAAIKTILDGLTYAENIHIFDHVKPEARRKYPSIEIDNQGSELRRQDSQIQENSQRFLIHLYYRFRADGSNDVANEKAIEDVIMAGLEAATLGGSKIFIEDKDWNRLYVSQPIHYVDATLTVFVTDITSTSGTGTIGAQWELTLPGLSGMQVLNKNPERDVELFDNRYNDEMLRQGVDYIGETRTFFGEVEATDARMTTLRSLKTARDAISATLTRNGVDENVTCKLVTLTNGAPYSQLETVAIQLEIFPS